MKSKIQIIIVLTFVIFSSFDSMAQSNEKGKPVKKIGAGKKSSPDEKIILDLLDKQTIAWNKGDIEGFMNGYWENDSLMYIGKSGITYGYHNTMNRYKRNYSDTTIMGKLKFTILHVNRLSNEIYQVIGKFHLTRTIGDAEGHYSLILKRMNGKWVIISDHSS